MREFVIPFLGLKLGSHSFEYKVDTAFFEEIEYSIIHDGEVQVDLVLDKKETMLIGTFSAQGMVSANCDRCNDPVRVPVKGSFQLIYTFGLEESDDETLVVLHPEAYEIDVQPAIYELITVSLPARLLHEEGECNEEMLEALSEYLINPGDEDSDEWDDDDLGDDDEDWEDDEDEGGDDDDIDPRWSALKNLN